MSNLKFGSNHILERQVDGEFTTKKHKTKRKSITPAKRFDFPKNIPSEEVLPHYTRSVLYSARVIPGGNLYEQRA